ncbi:hypothetical protein AAA799N04_01172 [Marine Group I thaumarchaeote SCGC AAA799-N04]|uniref:Uncharacterized protein n=1 Tax=Marine Group I thaumarchaeote SCGC AAA799-N04 TaxID=1502293 RepID=A0A081RMH7_9ARCH|nr:hypothetical protein AAA799N04_01172 [Marine Group I thaumarchaeote SCGC AAA799-N04]
MHYQCTFCDIDGASYKDFEECRQHGHEILEFLDQEDHKNSKPERKQKTIKQPKKDLKIKVKGLIDNVFVESIVLNGKPCFLCYDKQTKEITPKNEIENKDAIYFPISLEEYGYSSYSFSDEELDEMISSNISKEEILDGLKKIIDKFINASENIKHLILGDLFLTYSQEWVTTTHFLYFVGETESGKSSALHLFKILGYRCLYGVDIPIADIYNFLGLDEESTGIIAEDEAQELGFNRDKIRLYKNSYAKGSLKPIMHMLKDGRKQVFYKTFCFKVFAGEKVPTDKGFNERLAVIHMVQGHTEKNIKRPDRDDYLSLEKLRKQLLVWKIQNTENNPDSINSGLKARDQELWEDYLRIMMGTKYEKVSKEVVKFYTEQRHEKIWNSLEARIFKLVVENLKDCVIVSEELWQSMTSGQDISGDLDKATYTEHETGKKISRNTLAKLLEEKFQGTKKFKYVEKDGKPHKITYYVFDQTVIEKLSSKYNVTMGLDDFPSGTSGVTGQE